MRKGRGEEGRKGEDRGGEEEGRNKGRNSQSRELFGTRDPVAEGPGDIEGEAGGTEGL